jgi:hypothetical protein
MQRIPAQGGETMTEEQREEFIHYNDRVAMANAERLTDTDDTPLNPPCWLWDCYSQSAGRVQRRVVGVVWLIAYGVPISDRMALRMIASASASRR